MRPERLPIGTRISYTGDIAHASDWATIIEVGGLARLMYHVAFDGGGVSWISAFAIGDIYEGHCNPRFVTEAAYQAWEKERVEALNLGQAGRREDQS